MDVIPIVSQWSIDISNSGTTGTRTYISSAVLPGKSVVSLPVLYEAWDGVWTGLLATDISVSKIEGGCGDIYTVSYTSPANTWTQSEQAQSIEVASEYTIWTDPLNLKKSGGIPYSGSLYSNTPTMTSHWVWPDTSIATNLTNRIRNVKAGYTITRDVYANTLSDYLEEVESKVGKINSDTFQGIPSGLCLFLGADASESSLYGSKKWTVSLKFSIISNNGDWIKGHGHNRIFNPKTEQWEDVVNLNGQHLYDTTSFMSLVCTWNVAPPFPGV